MKVLKSVRKLAPKLVHNASNSKSRDCVFRWLCVLHKRQNFRLYFSNSLERFFSHYIKIFSWCFPLSLLIRILSIELPLLSVAYSSNLGMLGLLFAIATCDFDKTKLKKATVPNAEFEDSTNMWNSMQKVLSRIEKTY